MKHVKSHDSAPIYTDQCHNTHDGCHIKSMSGKTNVRMPTLKWPIKDYLGLPIKEWNDCQTQCHKV